MVVCWLAFGGYLSWLRGWLYQPISVVVDILSSCSAFYPHHHSICNFRWHHTLVALQGKVGESMARVLIFKLNLHMITGDTKLWSFYGSRCPRSLHGPGGSCPCNAFAQYGCNSRAGIIPNGRMCGLSWWLDLDD